MVYTHVKGGILSPMKSVTVQVPSDLFEALSAATERYGRPSKADMIRVILRRYLIEKPEEAAAAAIAANKPRNNKLKQEVKQRKRRIQKRRLQEGQAFAWQPPEIPIDPFPNDL